MSILKDLSIDQGATFDTYAYYLDNLKRPIDLTGYSLRGRIRDSYKSMQAINLNVSLVNSTTANIRINLQSDTTSILDRQRYVYDIEAYKISSNANVVIRLFEGAVAVNPGVTNYAKPTITIDTLSLTVSNIIPIADGEYNIGSPTRRFKDLYLTGNVIAGAAVDAASNKSTLVWVVDGGLSAPATGVKSAIEIPFNCRVDTWTLTATSVGSATFWIQSNTYANYPNVTTRSANNHPTLTSGQKARGNTSTWASNVFSVGDVIHANLISINALTLVTLTLAITKF